MTTPKRFKMLKDSDLNPKAKAGTIIYDLLLSDYGCANDDTRILGIEHKAVTLNPSGGYPFFTVPVADIEPQ